MANNSRFFNPSKTAGVVGKQTDPNLLPPVQEKNQKPAMPSSQHQHAEEAGLALLKVALTNGVQLLAVPGLEAPFGQPE